MNKPILAVDLDDVLCDFANPFLKFIAARGLKMMRADIRGSFTESGVPAEWIAEFSVSRTADLAIVSGAGNSMRKLACAFSIIVVTARPLAAMPITFGWIRRMFPDILGIVRSEDKGRICREINAVALIEDQIRYARQFENTYVLAQEWNLDWIGKRGTWNATVEMLLTERN